MKIGTGLLKIVTTGTLLGFSLSAAAAGLTQVHGVVPPMVSTAKLTGHHNPRANLAIGIALPLQNAAQLAQLLQDQRDPSSPNFHKFLTPAQFTAAYGPTTDQVNAVVAFLTQHGIPAKGITISPNHTRVSFTATTAVVESAFGVAINDYSYEGSTFYAASTDPTVPANLGVKAVFGLDDGVQWQAHNIQDLHPLPAGKGAGPSGYSPLQIATAYDWPDITNTANGAGVTIAIATAFTYRSQDIQKFWSTYGLPTTHTLTNTPINGTTNVLNAETTLDIERSSSMAPGAAIHVYECSTPANANFDTEFQTIATNDTEQVVTTSWGLSEIQTGFASIGAEHDAFVQMSTQGQIVMAAAGDNSAGDSVSHSSDSADFPSSDPFVIAAGGTELALNHNNTIANEIAWGTGNASAQGAGGADSLYFAEPAFETGTPGWVSNTNCAEDLTSDVTYTGSTVGVCTATSAPSRQTSDISLDGGTGYSIYYNGRWEVFIGTSFVAPQLAGFFAILSGQAKAATLPAAAPGLIGPGPALVFCLANDGNYGTTFHDITSGSNGFPAGTGWDHPTGWGSIDASALAGDAINNAGSNGCL
jgi:kumamolisin